MGTKLLRLHNDKKKSQLVGNMGSSGATAGGSTGGKRMRDIDTEELIADLRTKVSELELQNKRLKENVS